MRNNNSFAPTELVFVVNPVPGAHAARLNDLAPLRGVDDGRLLFQDEDFFFVCNAANNRGPKAQKSIGRRREPPVSG